MDWLRATGELAELIRTKDWSCTPLGVADRWPQSLRTAVGLLLGHHVPEVLVWGPGRVLLYNDAFRSRLGEGHPASLGRSITDLAPAAATSADVTTAVGVLEGRLAPDSDGRRHAADEEPRSAATRLNYRPVPAEDGTVGGVLGSTQATAEVDPHGTRAGEHARIVRQVTRGLLSSDDTERTMARVAASIGRFFGAGWCVLCELAANGETAAIFAEWHRDDLSPLAGKSPMPRFSSDDLRAPGDGEPMIVRDVRTGPRAAVAGYEALGISSFVGVLARYGARSRFLLAVVEDEPRTWLPDEVETAQDLANLVSIRLRQASVPRELPRSEAGDQAVFENAKHFPHVGGMLSESCVAIGAWKTAETRLQEREERHAFVVRLADAIRPMSDAHAIRCAVSRRLGEQLEVEGVLCSGTSDDGDANEPVVPARFVSGNVPAPEPVPDALLPLVSEACCVQEAAPIVVADSENDPRFEETIRERWRALGTRSAVSICLVQDLREAVVLCVHDSRPRPWTQAEIGLVVEVAERTRDALDRALAKRRLREHENRFRALVEATPGVVYSLGADWTGVRRFLGRGSIGHPEGPAPAWLDESIFPDDERFVRAAIDEALRSKTVFDLEHRVRRADGSHGWTRSRAVPTVDEHGDLLEWLGTATDVTACRLAAEENLRRRATERLCGLGKLAYGIAHDFNNLLQGLQGCSELALSRTAENHPARAALARMNASIRDASGITRQLMTFGGDGDVTDAPRPALVDALLSDRSPTVSMLLARDIELVLDLRAPCIHAQISSGELEQVLLNLVVNAKDAMPNGGRLTIATRRVHLDPREAEELGLAEAGDYLLLRVTDTGCGMDEQVATRAFDPFFTTKEFGRGNGLGLSSVQGLLRPAGTIELETSPGRGTSIVIHLPVVPPPPQPSRSAASTPEAPSPHRPDPRTVLVVEDDRLIRLGIRHYLEQESYRVLEAGDARKARQVFADHRHEIDLFLIDVQLKGSTDGSRLAAEIAGKSRSPVLYMSAHPQSLLVADGRLHPGALSLEKPFTKAALMAAVERALE